MFNKNKTRLMILDWLAWATDTCFYTPQFVKMWHKKVAGPGLHKNDYSLLNKLGDRPNV